MSEHYGGRALEPELNAKLVDEVRQHGRGLTQYIRYASSGEPLTHKLIFEMIEYAVRHSGVAVTLTTNGKTLDGFPLTAGGEITSTPAIINSGGNFGLLIYATDGYLYGYKTPWAYDSTKILWRNYLNDKYHSNANYEISSPSVSSSCLPSDKVYNWPNPAYGKLTNIRYYLGGDVSNVNVKIMDLSGELVTTLIGTTNKGFDNEVQWDISTVQSGIYIAVVELEGGCTETAAIKIAIVK